MQKGVFNEVAEFVEFHVVFTLDFTILLGWDYCLHALMLRLPKNGIRVIAFVRKQCLGVKPLNQAACLSAIRCCTLCNNSPDRHTIRIHGKMELCVEPPFVRLMS